MFLIFVILSFPGQLTLLGGDFGFQIPASIAKCILQLYLNDTS